MLSEYGIQQGKTARKILQGKCGYKRQSSSNDMRKTINMSIVRPGAPHKVVLVVFNYLMSLYLKFLKDLRFCYIDICKIILNFL